MHTIQTTHAESVATLKLWLETYAPKEPLLLVSGGSVAHLFAEVWPQLELAVKAKITLSLVDERYGHQGHSDSNWKLIETLGVQIGEAARAFPVLSAPETSLEDSAKLWETFLKDFIASGQPILAILGIGTDEHIAGIKPHSLSIGETTNLVSAYPWDDYQRITISPALFTQLSSAIIYLKGVEKQSVVAALSEDKDIESSPAQLAKRIPDCTVLFEE